MRIRVIHGDGQAKLHGIGCEGKHPPSRKRRIFVGISARIEAAGELVGGHSVDGM